MISFVGVWMKRGASSSFSIGNVQLFVEPQLLGNQTYVQANVPLQWSPNQLAYSFAFDLGNFGSAAALSLLMLLIGLGAAYVLIRWTGFFKIEA
jgi:multiple sugar transport system permease protein